MRYFAKINAANLEEDKMKRISKLGFISLLCLVLVIGGVFATWDYAQGTAAEVTETATIGLTAVGAESAKATITFTKNGYSAMIDDSDKDYRGELTIAGTIDIVVTIKDGADQEIYNNGITVRLDLSENFDTFAFAADASGREGEAKDVIALTSTSLTLTKGVENGWIRGTNSSGKVTFTYTLTNARLNELITLAKTDDVVNVYLPTNANYEAFATHISGKTVTLKAVEA